MSRGTQSTAPAGRRRTDPLAALAAVAEQRAQHGRRLATRRLVLRQLDRLLPPGLLAEPGGVVLVHLLPAGQRRIGQLRRPVEQQHPAAEQDDGSAAAHQPAIRESTAEPSAGNQRSPPTPSTSGPWRTCRRSGVSLSGSSSSPKNCSNIPTTSAVVRIAV